MNYPPRRISNRKLVQLMVILTLLAWATQTLFHQWGYGAPPQPAGTGPPAVIEVREQARVRGWVVRLRDVTRCSGEDAGAARWGEIIVTEFGMPQVRGEIGVERIRAALN